MSPSVCLLLALAGAPSAEDVKQAKQLFAAGARAYKKEQFRVALIAFEQAYELAPAPPVVFSAAQAHRMQFFADGDARRLRRSVALFEEYLAKVSRGGRRHHASRHLAVLRPILEKMPAAKAAPEAPEPPVVGVLITTSVDTATVTLTGRAPSVAPALFEVEPGTYDAEIRADGFLPTKVSVVSVRGRVVSTHVDLAPVPATMSIAGAPSARVEIDGVPVGRADEGRLFRLAPGDHRVVLLENGRRPFVQDLDLRAGAEVALTPSLEMTFQRQASYVLLAAGAMMLAGAAVSGVIAIERESTAQGILDRKGSAGWIPSDHRDYQDARSGRNGAARASIGLAIGAVITGAAGGALYWFDVPSAPGPTVAVSGRF